MKVALVSMMGNVGSTFNTQGGGYGLIQTKMIRSAFPSDFEIDVNPKPDTWSSYDIIYVCEGVNFVEGVFNVPGGPQEIHYEKMKAIAEYKGELAFSNVKFDFNKFNKRLKIDATYPDVDSIPVAPTFMEHGMKSGKAVIGDSHALSVWKPGYTLDFTPGRTLHGFLKRNTPEKVNKEWNEVVLYFGNIDLRFHLMRQPNPVEATKELFNKYVDFAKSLNNAAVVNLLPVEHESRKIPGTGLYKGEPFFGTRQERMELRKIANDIMNSSGLKTIQWPEEWVDEDGTKMLDILEQKQSVHLRPKFYPYINEITN